ncbi:MAG TPA: DUF421 domain-containing protein [Bdellovibrionales bacterium]|nr:DUF421 domain-containing protein [Bdellovibrionales bacterium]
MESALRGLFIYTILLTITRISGRRTLAQMTAFDFVLLLIISEATQQALLGNDFSGMNAIIVIATLVLMDIGLSLAKQRSALIDKLLDGVPTVLVRQGEFLEDRVSMARLSRDDILEAARREHGLSRFDQIQHAVLERDGGISIIPNPGKTPPRLGR